MRFAIPAGFTNGEQFEAALKDAFDVLYAEGKAGAPKMMSIGLHCRLIGRPSRAAALRRVIEYFQSHEQVWFATRLQIAEHWTGQHPPSTKPGPSEMALNEFIAEFGGVFEHSSWIAERAYALELGPTHDTVAGIHSALVRVFRSASEKERLGVLNAHPDLAGKLAAAGRLTAESAFEQAGAGLDMLTDEELQTFTELNEAYTSKFGFPFIIAVRDHDKASILERFQKRIENSMETEFKEACQQVERIAEIRLEEKFSV